MDPDAPRFDAIPGTFLPLWRQLPQPEPAGMSYEIPPAALALHFYRIARQPRSWWRRWMAAVARWW
jgi:hypothetical protein